MHCAENYIGGVFQNGETRDDDIEEDGCDVMDGSRQVSGEFYNALSAQNAQMVVSGQTCGFTGHCNSTEHHHRQETPSPWEEDRLLKEYKKKAAEVHKRKSKLLFTQKTENAPRRTERPPRFREYRSFEIRLKSFIGFKSSSIYPVEMFAKAGFFYKGFSDIVACFQCGVIHKDWQLNDDPVQIHILLKKDCLYVIELTSEGIYTSKDFKNQNDSEMAEVTTATNNMSISTATPINQQTTRTETPPDQRLLCKVCTLNQIEVTVQPCGHFAMCQSCSRQLISNNMGCPICRGPIRNMIRTYID